MISQTSIYIINRPAALHQFCNRIVVRVIHLNTMLLHPIFDSFLISPCYIFKSEDILPQLHLEPVAYALVKTHLASWWEVVIYARVHMLEMRQLNLYLSWQRADLWVIVRVAGLLLQEKLKQLRLCRSPFDGNRVRSTALMSQPLCEIRFKGKENCVCHIGIS